MVKRRKAKKEKEVNLYYMKDGQTSSKLLEDEKKKKAREKRIRENKKKKLNDDFDEETEMVIQMTNKNNIKKGQGQRKLKDKEEHENKKRNKNIKLFVKLILFIGLVLGGVVFTLVSPIFNIQEIIVVGNVNVPEDTIISLSGLLKDENLFKFLSINVINKIKENPYVEYVKIHRKFPNKVEIEIEEREPKYTIQLLGSYVDISEQGYILEISEDRKSLPMLQGIRTPEEEVLPGLRLNSEDLDRLEDIIKIMNAAQKYQIDERVTSIDISSKNEYSIYIQDEDKTIHLGNNTNLSDKMLNAVTIMEKEKEKAGEVFVNGDLNNRFQPYFREKV